ncbi:MAG: alpha/beta fold hydrolase [Candidatus Coatesbacteria bacterium]|nr:MAG: alpha/beta fold hydrolase [Candidatus Coatesbacteria bacterium]
MGLIQNHPVLTAVAVVVILLVIAGAFFFAFVWRTIGLMVGARVPAHTVTPDAFGLPYADFACETADGINLHGWYIPCENTRATVLMLNGDRGERDGLLGHARFLHEAGCSVILFDYRHHGESDDDAITYGAREVLDAEAVLAHARANDMVRGKLVVFGISMGAATAALAAPEMEGVDGYILSCGYARFSDAMKGHIQGMLLPAPVVYPITRMAFRVQTGGADPGDINPVESIDDVHVPVLIIQGGRDQTIHESHGDALYEAANEPKTYAYFPEADHIIVWDELDEIRNERYKSEIISFIDSVCENGGEGNE